jgi:hypothetical protein
MNDYSTPSCIPCRLLDMLRHKPYLRNVQAAQCFLGCICALSMSPNTSVPARLTAANACTEQTEITHQL